MYLLRQKALRNIAYGKITPAPLINAITNNYFSSSIKNNLDTIIAPNYYPSNNKVSIRIFKTLHNLQTIHVLHEGSPGRNQTLKVNVPRYKQFLYSNRMFDFRTLSSSVLESLHHVRFIFEKSKRKSKVFNIINKPRGSVLEAAYNISYKKNYDIATKLVNFNSQPKHFFKQVRFFKTEKYIEMENRRNASLLKRITEFFGFRNASPVKSSNVNLVKELEEFQTSLRKKNLSPEISQKLILAFVEGYSFALESFTSQKSSWKLYHLYVVLFICWLTVNILKKPSTASRISLDTSTPSTKFDDVKGADAAKQELKNLVEFLKTPDKFSAIGGKLPKGVLLVGPPGTGKTLLAKAVAGEAGVPFFCTSGSEFDEIYVGVGAKRIRELFKLAKENTPCVIFIDEIDSVGKQRTSSSVHPHANDTINQLLSEMDGFRNNGSVIVLGATNRKKDLDTALLRPGRFDVEVTISLPDYQGRKELLEFFLRRIRHQNVDIEKLARGTTNFTGADIENLVNQAAVRAAGSGAEFVSMEHLEYSRDKVLMGPESLSRIPDEETNRMTAYHEGGHALVAHYTADAPPLHKVTIIARGTSLGHTAYIPDRDIYHVTKTQMLATLDTTMGGRAAEEVVFGPDKITSGASSDLKKATQLATNMVRMWGMSELVGLSTFDNRRLISPEAANLIDAEIKTLLRESYDRAKNILTTHREKHKKLSEALLKYETLDASEIAGILKDE